MSQIGAIGHRTTFMIALCVLLLIASAVSTVLVHRGHVAAGMAGFISMVCLLEFVTCGWAALEKLILLRERVVVLGVIVHVAATAFFLAIWLRGTELSLTAILFPMILAPLLLIQSYTIQVIPERWLKARTATTVE